MSKFCSFVTLLRIVILLFYSHCFRVFGDKIENSIYKKLTSFAPCVRLLNATHQIGCTSKRKGNVGVLHYIASDEDIDWLLNEGEHAPYVALFKGKYFTDERLRKLGDSGKLAGVLVDPGGSPDSGFSPEYKCPNGNFGIYKTDESYSCRDRGKKSVPWNKDGSEMSYRSYDFPIFLLDNTDEVAMLVKCFSKYNQPQNGTKPDYPLCAAEMQNFMFAAKDTPTCMRKNEAPTFTEAIFCDPLGDYNVWGTLFPMIGNISKDDIILATAKLDSTSFFHKLVPTGAENDITGVIALLAAADALGNLKRTSEDEISAPDLTKNEKHIMFSLFHGEVWDYIGSSRMVYDMINGDFPSCADGGGCTLSKVALNNIAYFLELNQVGLVNGSLWAHSDPLSKSSVGPKISKMFDIFEKLGENSNLTIKDPSGENDQPLPPASFQSFLKTNVKIPGLVITDHKTHFRNRFYNSRFDNYLALGVINNTVEDLTKLATIVANGLYELAYNKTNKNIVARKNVVHDLFTCFLITANCTMFKSVSTKTNVAVVAKQTTPFSRYVGPFDKKNANNLAITKMTKLLLSYFTGWHNPNNQSCTDTGNFALDEMKHDSICVNSTVYLSPALSPAFVVNDYASTEYSTWTESRWDSEIGLRMFLIGDPNQEIITLVVGIVLTLLAAVVTIFMYKHADKVFSSDDVLVINDIQ